MNKTAQERGKAKAAHTKSADGVKIVGVAIFVLVAAYGMYMYVHIYTYVYTDIWLYRVIQSYV